ncbi:hypothetical protein AOC36_10550 [Erysipelothrix larvae]|uniref:trans-2-enoyl-CoA reductase (NAD(+)) n=1 Tax=Erysipelothrix larvae TaxID=1514105 RepID=A0A0X8H206_9FIRM|nr:enoyl-ACP reductase FabV [Erysipelothrix larvae]AMC94394.1 hypothetical protein AOC36_10550 [Erysipelothrix larvae]
MSHTPIIRDNIALNAHPMGCKQNILNQIESLNDMPQILDRPLNVLILGGSSGYGLATRIVLAFKAHAYTFNVSFERGPKGKSSGSAGYYNNLFFHEIAQEKGLLCDDLNADCFSHETKDAVINHFKSCNKTIDLVVYSVASGIRIDPDTHVKTVSSLKPIQQTYSGYTVDIARETLKYESVEPATPQEIEDTVTVMGGADYALWAQALSKAQVLSEGCTFVTYTYLGAQSTHAIYKNGTIGAAKKDLNRANQDVNDILAPLHGKAVISASKAVVTKASVFIPTMALYASALFQVMKERGTHETTVEHTYRLFKEMIYGDSPEIDDDGFYRLDQFEMDPQVQSKVHDILSRITPENFKDLVNFDAFKKEFLNINGFDVDGCDYTQDQ